MKLRIQTKSCMVVESQEMPYSKEAFDMLVDQTATVAKNGSPMTVYTNLGAVIFMPEILKDCIIDVLK